MSISPTIKNLVGIWPGRGKFANITWQVSDVCNYKCSYCNPGNYGANHRNLETSRYIQVLSEMIGHFRSEGYEHFKFFFSGGEPTVWPPFLEICRYLREEIPSATLAVNTNFSRPLSWWKEHGYLFNDIVASFHIEQVDKEKYFANAEYMQYQASYLACRMLMHDERFSEVADFAEVLKERLLNCVVEYAGLFEELSPHSEMHFYKDEWKREFLKNNNYFAKKEAPFSRIGQVNHTYCMEVGEDLARNGLNATRLIGENRNKFKGWKCWINDSIFIDPRGNVNLASCDMAKNIGNIHTGKLNFLKAPVICALSSCGCGTDINIRKVQPKFEKLVEQSFL
jgi:organic radical activating enzyme